jgi:hypothetical protein
MGLREQPLEKTKSAVKGNDKIGVSAKLLFWLLS